MLNSQIKKTEQSPWWKYGVMLSGLISLVLLAYFAGTTVYSSDDYWYSTFWDNGLKGYLELMDYHYKWFNGRVVVHILAHVILHFENWAFVIVCCGLCLAMPFLAGKSVGIRTERIAAAVVLFLMGILVMPGEIFMQGMMWISAFCNYMFPAALACFLAVMLERRRNSNWLFVLAFLCGATTEQMGLASIVLIVVYTIDAAVRKDGFLRCLLSAGFAALGLWTVFLSPATMLRATNKVVLNSLSVILETFRKAIIKEAALLTEGPVVVILLLALMLLIGVALWRKNGKKWHIPICVIGASALIMGVFGNDDLCVAGFVVTFIVLAVLAVAMIVCGHRFVGAMILTALVAAAVMLPTKTVEARVMLPFYVLTLLSVSVLAAQLYSGQRRICLGVLGSLVLTCVYLVPVISGYWTNYQVDQLNKTYASEDYDAAVVRYCTDYDMDYTWLKADFDPYFQFKYLQSIGLPEDTPMYFFSRSDEAALIRCGDDMLTGGVILGENGEKLFPLREILEHFGGTLEWSEDNIVILLDGNTYAMEVWDQQTVRVCWNGADGETQEISAGYTSYHGITYCEWSVFTEVFGLTIQEDRENCQYLVTQ